MTKRTANRMSFSSYWRAIPKDHALLHGLTRSEKRAKVRKWWKAELQNGRLRRKDDAEN